MIQNVVYSEKFGLFHSKIFGRRNRTYNKSCVITSKYRQNIIQSLRQALLKLEMLNHSKGPHIPLFPHKIRWSGHLIFIKVLDCNFHFGNTVHCIFSFFLGKFILLTVNIALIVYVQAQTAQTNIHTEDAT